jgi:sugar phosphate permease
VQAADPYRWVVLTVGATAQGAFAALFFGLPVIAPALRDRYHLGEAGIGLVLASVNIGTLASVLPWGLLADRIGERIVLSVGLVGCGITTALAAPTRGAPALVVLVTLAGLLGASVQASSGRAVMAWFPARQRALALAIRQTATPVGGALVAVALPPIVRDGGVPASLLTLGAVSVLAGLLGAVLLRPAPGERGRARGGDRHPFRDPALWRLSSGSALLIIPQTAVLGFVVLFLHDTRGLSAGAAAGILAASQAGGAVLRLGAGHRSDRTGRRLVPLVRLSLALATALAVTTTVVHGPLLLLAISAGAAGALSLSWNALSFTATAELAGAARAGAALGLQQTALATASVVAPIAFGLLVEHAGWTAAFAMTVVATLAGAGVLWPLARREYHGAEPT